MPETLNSLNDTFIFCTFFISYFVLIPFAHWLFIIRAGKQKLWRIIVPFSMGCVMARYTFPSDIANYFEFITWLRYPVIAILLCIEFYLMFVVARGLWQARHLTGDPRINALSMHSDDKKRSLAFMLAMEPMSWYYTLPWLSKRHPPSLVNINLLSAKRWHYLGVICVLIATTLLSYTLVLQFSHWGALALSAFIFYGVVLITANYRMSRHHSCYMLQASESNKKLVINNSVWGFLSVDSCHIHSIVHGNFSRKAHSESLFIGRGSTAAIKVTFTESQTYYGAMGHLTEAVDHIFLCVEDGEQISELALNL